MILALVMNVGAYFFSDKIVLAMQHELIPQSLHFSTPSPHIPWDQLPVVIAKEAMPWPSAPFRKASPRLSAMNWPESDAFTAPAGNVNVVR